MQIHFTTTLKTTIATAKKRTRDIISIIIIIVVITYIFIKWFLCH